MQFNHLDYDFYHLGISGGKDSTAVLLWAVYESGWPLDRLVISFCDTNNEDALTYDYLGMLSERVFPHEAIKPPLDFWELAYKKRRFPGAKSRFCTQHLKVIPSMRYVSALTERGNVLLLSGTRRAEGRAHNNRGDLEQFRYNDMMGSDEYLPIYEYRIEDVWLTHKRHLKAEWVTALIEADECLSDKHKKEIVKKINGHSIPRNPLYDMGAKRVGCFPCINSRKAEIRAMAKYRPERIDFLDEKEKYVGERSNFGFSSFFPATTVPLAHRQTTATAEDGRSWDVCSIHDVVNWAKTAHGGKQYDFDFMSFDEDEPLICDYRGMCE